MERQLRTLGLLIGTMRSHIDVLRRTPVASCPKSVRRCTRQPIQCSFVMQGSHWHVVATPQPGKQEPVISVGTSDAKTDRRAVLREHRRYRRSKSRHVAVDLLLLQLHPDSSLWKPVEGEGEDHELVQDLRSTWLGLSSHICQEGERVSTSLHSLQMPPNSAKPSPIPRTLLHIHDLALLSLRLG
jgi:hypothetical protein